MSPLSRVGARPSASSASSSATLLDDASDVHDKEHGESSECILTPRHAAHTISLPSLDAPRFQRVRRVEPSTGPPQSTLLSLVPRAVSAWWTLCFMCGCGDAFGADGFQTCSRAHAEISAQDRLLLTLSCQSAGRTRRSDVMAVRLHNNCAEALITLNASIFIAVESDCSKSILRRDARHEYQSREHLHPLCQSRTLCLLRRLWSRKLRSSSTILGPRWVFPR